MLKVLHAADLHIRDKNIEEAAECLECLIDTAREQAVNLIVIAGDCFDSRDIKLDSKAAKLVIKSISRLADIAPVAIVTGTASHDGSAPEILRYARGKYDVHVSTIPEQLLLHDGAFYERLAGKNKPDAVISLVPTPTKQFFNIGDIQTSNEAIAHGMAGLFAGFGAQDSDFPRVPHLLAGHWQVSGCKLSTGQCLTGQDIEISIDQMNLTNASAHLLGHIHMPQQLGVRTFYSGSLYPLTWGELEEKGFYIHEFDCDELYKSEFVKTPCRKLVRYALDLTTENIEYMDNFIIHHVSTTNVKDAYIRIDVTTWQDEAGKVNKDDIIRQYLVSGAVDVDIRIIRIPRQTVRSEAVLKVQTLREKLVAMAALKGETVPESILLKADELENRPAEDVVRRAA